MHVVVHEFADPATCLWGQGAIVIVRITSNLAGKRGSSIVTSIGNKSLFGGLSHSRFAGLSPLILLFEYAYELLVVNIFLGICIDKVKLTSNKLISKLIPRFQQGRCDNVFKEKLRNTIVHVSEEAELVLALLKF